MGLGILVRSSGSRLLGLFPGLYGFKVLGSWESLKKGGEVGLGHWQYPSNFSG
jgi:hypothetical protein